MKLTLEKPKACRIALISPIILPMILFALSYVIYRDEGIIVIGVAVQLLFIILYPICIMDYYSGIGIVESSAKRNFEIRAGKKVYKQWFYEEEYHMTLIEFIQHINNMSKNNKRKLKNYYREMKDNSFKIDNDAIYYKSGTRLLELIYEEDESDSKLLHIDKCTATWSYNAINNLHNRIVLTKAEKRAILDAMEEYLKENKYRVNYTAPLSMLS